MLKNRLGHIIPSLGVLCALPIIINEFRVLLNFYIFDVWDFDVMIGTPIKKLMQEGSNGQLEVKLGKCLSFSMPIIHALKSKEELPPEVDPIEEVKAITFEEIVEPHLEDDTQFFMDEEDPINLEPIDDLLEPSKPSIELKPLPSRLKYVFLNDDQNSPVIIRDKLSEEESLRVIAILEKHHAAFGYSLQDLKGISLVLCTHRVPTIPEVIPSREPQRRLNNAMREVVKKDVLKLLHAGIIYPVPQSEWVSPVQVMPKKGGMTVVQNDKNELIPQKIVNGW
jgi:hypothetical protein